MKRVSLKKHPWIILASGISFAIASCSDSVLFDREAAVTPAPGGGPGGPGAYPQQGGGMGPQSQYGQSPYTGGPFSGGQGGAQGGPAYVNPQSGPMGGGSVRREMTFILNPDRQLSDDEVFQFLFTDQAVDPFKINQVDAKNEMRMAVQSKEARSNENRVSMTIVLMMKLGSDTSLVREFKTRDKEWAVIHTDNNQDILEATLYATDGRGQAQTSLKVVGRRSATPAQLTGNSQGYDETYLWKNAWSGELRIHKGDSDLRLGSFQGFMTAEKQ